MVPTDISPLRDRAYRMMMQVRPAPLVSLLKRALGVKRVGTETKNGIFWVDPVSLIGRELLDKKIFEPDLTEQLKRILKPGQTFVDLGANEGYFTIIAGKAVGPAGRVLAIEPQNRLKPVIERNAALNGLENIIIDTSLVSDHRGTARLALSADTNPGSTGTFNAALYPVRWQDVEADTLSAILDRHEISHVHCLKVDIEGSECEAILGSKNLFTNGRVGTIFIELHHSVLLSRGRAASEIVEFLKGSNFIQIWNSGDYQYAFQFSPTE